MAAPVRKPMTSDEFIAWAMEQPDGERFELVAGEVVGMSPERLSHARVKHRIARALEDAIVAGGLRCEALPDGVSVEVDERTSYQPDALVRCGDPLPGDTVALSDPMIVVEVISPSSRARDTGAKLEDYFRLPTVRHYLIVRTDSCSVIHHGKGGDGAIVTRILHGGPLELDPPESPSRWSRSFPDERLPTVAPTRQDRGQQQQTRDNRDDPHPSPSGRAARRRSSDRPLRPGAGAAAWQGHLLHPDPARRVPERQPGRIPERAGCDGLRGHLARRAEPRRPPAQPARGRDQHQARRDHHERRRLRRDRPGHREGACGRHQGAELRPADPFHAVRPDLGRGHDRDRPSGGCRGDRTADGEVRQPEGQDAADPGRPRRHLHARHPEGLRGGDGQGSAGRRDHQQAGDAVGAHQCRQGVRGPDAGEPRHRPGVRAFRAPDRADRVDHGSQGQEAGRHPDARLQRHAGGARPYPPGLAAGRGRAADLRPGLWHRDVPADDPQGREAEARNLQGARARRGPDRRGVGAEPQDSRGHDRQGRTSTIRGSGAT